MPFFKHQFVINEKVLFILTLFYIWKHLSWFLVKKKNVRIQFFLITYVMSKIQTVNLVIVSHI